MELCGLYAQFHDCVSGSLRGVDRVHVGVHVGCILRLRAILPRHSRHRKPGGEFPLLPNYHCEKYPDSTPTTTNNLMNSIEDLLVPNFAKQQFRL